MVSKQIARTALTIFWLLLLTVDAVAMSGNEWKQLPRSSRDAYIWGVVDTWQNLAATLTLRKAVSPSPSEAQFTDLARCLSEGMTYGQISAIVKKYMEDNPSEWHYGMASLAWSAVHKACFPTGQ
jgi:hypothetical protein